MTALELNAEIYKSLGVLASDEHYLKKVAGYLRKLAKKKAEESDAVMSDEEIKEGLLRACNEFNQYKEGNVSLGKWEDLYGELRG